MNFIHYYHYYLSNKRFLGQNQFLTTTPQSKGNRIKFANGMHRKDIHYVEELDPIISEIDAHPPKPELDNDLTPRKPAKRSVEGIQDDEPYDYEKSSSSQIQRLLIL